MFEGLDRNIKIRLLLHFLEKFFEGAVAPFFVIFLAGRLGAFELGIYLTVALAIAGAASLFGGHLADERGRRAVLVPVELVKAVALVALAVACASEGGLAPAYAALFFYFIVVLCNGIAGPVSEAVVLDAAKPADMRRIYAALYWLTNVARSVGTLVGTALYAWSFGSVIGLNAVLAVVAAWIVLTRLHETRRPAAAGSRSGWRHMLAEYRIVLSDRLMLVYVGASILNFGIAVQLAYYVAVRLASEFPPQVLVSFGDWAPVVTGVMMFGILRLETNFIAVTCLGLAQRWTAQIPAVTLFMFGPVAAAAGFAVLMVSNDGWALVAAMALYTGGELVYTPAKTAMIARIAPADARSRYAAVRAFDFRVALVLGAIGVALAPFVPSWAMSLTVLVMGAAIIVMLTSVERALGRREQAAMAAVSGSQA